MESESIRNASITTDMFNYSYRPDVKTKLGLFHDRGFRYIHWCDDWRSVAPYSRHAMEEHRRLIETSRLKCLDVHSAETDSVHICAETEENLEAYITALKNRMEFCSLVGGDAVVIHPPGGEKGSRSLRWKTDRTYQVLDAVRSLCEKLGIVLAVENCYPTDEKVFEEYFGKYPPDFLGLCLDSGHANVNHNLSSLLRFGNRLRALHLHDNKGDTDDHQPPFWGTIDWESLMQWIGQSRYRKPINFEITHRMRLFDGPMDEYLDFAARSVRRAMAILDR